MTVQIIRRVVQVSVVLLVAGLALLSLYAHYRAARVIDDDQLMAGLRGEVATRLIHPLVERLDDPQGFLESNGGTVWSMELMGYSITDPLAALEAVAASRHVHVPLLLSVILPVVLTLILGKVFCSWICPGYLLFEIAGKLRRLLRLAEIELKEVRFSFLNKYIFLVVGVVLAAVLAAPFFALVYPPAVVSRVIHAWIFGTELVGMVILLGVIIAFEVFVAPRWWCRTMCPGGALYGLLGSARLVRVELAREDCNGCRDCIPVCEAGINPITESRSMECDNCGVCIRHCKPAALGFTLALPGAAHRGKRRGVSRVRVVGGAAALLVTLLVSPDAAAHHVLGLPHYSYKENYPQRPTLEYPARTGPYDVLFTSYPGLPRPGEPANLAFYIKNRQSGEVYRTPVTVRVLETSTFGDNTVVLPPTRCLSFDNQFKTQCVFPADAEYVVELSLVVEGRTEVIPFLVIAGEPTAAVSIFLAGAVAALVFFVAVRAVQRKRRRRLAGAQGRKGSGEATPPRRLLRGCFKTRSVGPRPSEAARGKERERGDTTESIGEFEPTQHRAAAAGRSQDGVLKQPPKERPCASSG